MVMEKAVVSGCVLQIWTVQQHIKFAVQEQYLKHIQQNSHEIITVLKDAFSAHANGRMHRLSLNYKQLLHSRHIGQPVLADNYSHKWRILLVQSSTVRMPLLTATHATSSSICKP